MLLYLTKKSCFYKKSFGKRKLLYFWLRLFSRKCALQSFHSKHLRNCYRNVKFFLNFSHLKSYHKNQAHGSHHTQSNIFNKSVIILTCHICIWNLNVVSFLRTFHELKNQILVHAEVFAY